MAKSFANDTSTGGARKTPVSRPTKIRNTRKATPLNTRKATPLKKGNGGR